MVPKKQKIETIRHSTAHLLAAAVLELYPEAALGIGPAIENGFYYDFCLPDKFSADDLPHIEEKMRELIKKGIPFKKQLLSLPKAVELFKKRRQPLKLELLKDLKEKGTTRISSDESQDVNPSSKSQISIYQTGDFIDLCRGPHVASTKDIPLRAFALTRVAGAYWRGDETKAMLTRIYGVAFAAPQELATYLAAQKEIEKRDHRRLGRELDLFSFHEIAPGAAFWHANGMIIWRELETFIREKLDAAGYQEIATPVMVKKSVFERSGHWKHYRDDMFFFQIENETYALKPMNCPESTYIYGSRTRSYRELPLRLSEVTDQLHRNERSGVVGGLMRVRQMTQDDAHIYCTPGQIESEIQHLLRFIEDVYEKFSFPVSYKLATMPAEAMGSPKLWKKAEAALKRILKKTGKPFEIKQRDGAFYGPKIDVHVYDSLGRDWQLATIQLDWQLAENFDLQYIDERGKKRRPVVIHRAVYGTFERFIGILIEHYAGAFPFWLSPVQVGLIPVASRHIAYAHDVARKLRERNIRAEVSEQNETVGKKIREGEIRKIPFLLVMGDVEEKNRSVRVRERGKGDRGEKSFSELAEKLDRLRAQRRQSPSFPIV